MIRTQLKKYKPFAQGIMRQLTGYNYFASLLLCLLANIWQGVGENQNLETNSADVLDRYERLKV